MIILMLDVEQAGMVGSMSSVARRSMLFESSGAAYAFERSCLALDWLDALFRELNSATGFREGVLLSLVIGAGRGPLLQQTTAEQQSILQPVLWEMPLVAASGTVSAYDFQAIRRPLQSYQFSGMQRVQVDAARPAVGIHRLAGIIRFVACVKQQA
jgi:hypothetical protein